MQYEVIDYDEKGMYHLCKQPGRNLVERIDLMVDGGFDDAEPESLVGTMVEIDRLQPYISIGCGVKSTQTRRV